MTRLPAITCRVHALLHLQRPRGEAYGRRQERLSGTKRERLERHLRFKEAGDGGLEFFAKKKLEGSVDAAAS
jgi:hypothetical protein